MNGSLSACSSIASRKEQGRFGAFFFIQLLVAIVRSPCKEKPVDGMPHDGLGRQVHHVDSQGATEQELNR